MVRRMNARESWWRKKVCVNVFGLVCGNVSPSHDEIRAQLPLDELLLQQHVALILERHQVERSSCQGHVHPNLNTPPGTPELAIAPLNFASGTNDKSGPVCSTCGKSLEYLTQTATDIILLVINQVIRQNR
jgi:hypothetical protein